MTSEAIGLVPGELQPKLDVGVGMNYSYKDFEYIYK